MAGDPANASLFAEADVFIGATDAVNPTDIDDDFGVTWDLIGLLDGSAGFVYARSEDTTDLFAWGGIIVRTTRKNFKQTVTFTALEDNDTTRALVWPGSDLDGPFIVPRPIKCKIGLERRDPAGGIVKRLISTFEAEVTLDGDVTENEDSLASLPFIATIFPNGDGELWTPQETVGT